ncbi:CvpA family protein [Candidatus Aerophobetes bacterium]|uniref:CvpA family protein n=1 Tax=Aerophobetes bacterium TaxID=2030807 RepID=A0A523ZIZ0_UNCAE|nr:MAG: CvpA family protein [Candidatus Aerophobetes bacterium]
MNWLDVVWLIVIVFFLVRGAMKGFFREIFGLLGVFVGLIVAVNYSQGVGNIIRGEITRLSPQIAKGISFAIIFVGIALIGGLIGLVFHGMLRSSPVKGIDRGGGLILGLLEGGVVCSVILIFLTISPLAENADRWKKDSTISPYLMKIGPFVYDSIASIVPGEAKKFMEKIDEFKQGLSERR